MTPDTAERWCDAWEIEAAGRGLPKNGDYWTLGAALDRYGARATAEVVIRRRVPS